MINKLFKIFQKKKPKSFGPEHLSLDKEGHGKSPILFEDIQQDVLKALRGKSPFKGVKTFTLISCILQPGSHKEVPTRNACKASEIVPMVVIMDNDTFQLHFFSLVMLLPHLEI